MLAAMLNMDSSIVPDELRTNSEKGIEARAKQEPNKERTKRTSGSNPLKGCAASVLCDAFNKPFFKVVNKWLPVLEGFIIQAII